MSVLFKKRTIVFFAVILVSTGLVLAYFLPVKTSKCVKSESWVCIDPAYDIKTRTYVVNGVLRSKSIREGGYFLEIDLYGKNHNPQPTLFGFPPPQIKTTVTGSSEEGKYYVNRYSPKGVYDLVDENDEVKVFMISPSEEDIKNARNLIRDKAYLDCLSHNEILGKYLINPSIYNRVRLFIDKTLRGCPVALLTIQK